MNDQGYFDVPMPAAIILGVLFVCFIGFAVFSVGVQAGVQLERERCALKHGERQ